MASDINVSFIDTETPCLTLFRLTRFWFRYQKIHITRIFSEQ